jgi:pseudouridine synthase
VKGLPEEKEIDKLKTGVKLIDGITAPAKVKKIRITENNSWLEMTIYEGRKRQIRRMLEKIDHPVLKLKRIKINGIELGKIETGEYRYLTPEEVNKMKREVVLVS